MIRPITHLDELFTLQLNLPLLDVRAPIEFEQGHIPQAINFPILNNEERKLVGTCYKQNGHEAAVVLGYKLVGPNFHILVKQAYKQFKNKKVIVHCYRGGLRSRIMANLLSTAGFEVHLVQGGYKNFRHWALQKLTDKYSFKILGGYTGSGKTAILKQLAATNKQVLDLEKLANHKGSAFGHIGLPPQPTNEQFENLIACQLNKLNITLPIWVEDESSLIGRCKIPQYLFNQMRSSMLYFMDVPLNQRVNNIVNEYGQFDKNLLLEATSKLERRLGNLRMKEAIAMLENNDFENWVMAMLIYYDKTYQYGMDKRSPENIVKSHSIEEFLS